MYRAAPALILLTVLLCALGCRESKPDQLLTPAPPSVELRGIEVLAVDLDHPVLARDAQGEGREWTTAHMVRLELVTERMPVARGFHIFVGEHHVAEMGGWQKGVYFWVYDPAQLRSMDGGELSYQVDGYERRSLEARLSLDELDDVPRVKEASLFPNREPR